jgi:hypothetical protein
MEIDRSGALLSFTGECSCNTRWYTMGLKPGKVTVKLTVIGAGQPLAVSKLYAVTASMEHGGIYQDGTVQVTCSSAKHKCGKTGSFSFTAKTKGVYYVFVHGLAANGISYKIAFIAPHAYSLHCHQFC